MGPGKRALDAWFWRMLVKMAKTVVFAPGGGRPKRPKTPRVGPAGATKGLDEHLRRGNCGVSTWFDARLGF
jgi:hypothetical protein